MIYADFNATSPLSPAISAAMQPFLEEYFVNPSSVVGDSGEIVSRAIAQARESVARLVDAEPDEVVFTSGGTESCYLALLGAHLKSPDVPILLSSVEHPAVYECAQMLSGPPFNAETSEIPVTSEGDLDLESFKEQAGSSVIVSCMLANNETGVCFPVQELRKFSAPGSLIHTDATQAVGKIPVSFRELGVDLLSLSGHKFGAPKGVGALIVKRGAPWQTPMKGGGQEAGRRGGTLAVAQIVGLGEAARHAEALERSAARDAFEQVLVQLLSGVKIHGASTTRMPNTSNVYLPGARASEVVELLGKRGICIAAGSACSSGSDKPSRVLRAMAVPVAECFSSVRVSFGPQQDAALGKLLAEELADAARSVRGGLERELEALTQVMNSR